MPNPKRYHKPLSHPAKKSSQLHNTFLYATMRQAPINSWSLLKLRRSATTNSGGARRWLCLVIVFVLIVYVVAASWFLVNIFPSQSQPIHSQPQPPPPPVDVVKGYDEEEDIHVVFSTGCNLFQHWQAEVVLHSHMKVGQKGKITRVVSGCDTESEKREHAEFLTQ
jgi:hypothetical protein